MEYLKYLNNVVPLLQTLSWIALILILAIKYRNETNRILETMIKRIEQGSGLKIGPVEIGKLESDIREVKDKVSELNDLVSKQFLIAMGPDMYKNLKMINSGHFGFFEFGEWSGLERELYFLRDIGYIQTKSIREIKKIGKGDNLSDFVTITETGRKFVELRESILGQK
jgi:hypothetical protein